MLSGRLERTGTNGSRPTQVIRLALALVRESLTSCRARSTPIWRIALRQQVLGPLQCNVAEHSSWILRCVDWRFISIFDMSKNFTFPPPPPPPPKATTTWKKDTAGFNTTKQDLHYARGDRSERGDHVGSTGYGTSSAKVYNDTHLHGPGLQDEGPAMRNYRPNHSLPIASSLPPGAYVNPSIHAHVIGQRNANVHPPQAQPGQTTYTPAGRKRKLEVLRGSQQERMRIESPIAPEVPRFGEGQPSSSRHGRSHFITHRNASPPNAFGLVPTETHPHDDSSEASEDDKEVDEETLFAELGDKLTFEHNGTVMTLSTAADIAAWQLERKKNWPTKARVEEKDAVKRVVGAERRRLLSAADVLNEPMAGMSVRRTKREATAIAAKSQQNLATPAVVGTESELQSMRRKLVEQTEKLESLRRKVAGSQVRLDDQKARQVVEDDRLAESLAQRMPRTNTPAREELSGEMSDMLSDSSVVSSDSDDDSIGSSAHQGKLAESYVEEHDDGAPEEASSKRPEKASAESRPLCRYFAASGKCRDGNECRFRHESQPYSHQDVVRTRPAPKPLPSTSTTSRKGISQRLAEQEQKENDRLVLQVVKSLGSAGFFK
nr:hypothetical protein CFP56_22277 [Quercus suber]